MCVVGTGKSGARARGKVGLRTRNTLVLSPTAAVTLAAGRFAHGANTTWTSTSSSLWATPGNWNGGVPTANNTAFFNSATTQLNVSLAASQPVGNITFNGTAEAYTISGGTLAVANG